MLRGGREEPGAVGEADGSQKAAEFYMKRDFGGSKGAELETCQACQEHRIRQVQRGFRIWVRQKWVLVCCDGDR